MRVYNNFMGSLRGAVDQPGFRPRRAASVLSSAQVLTQQLNSMTTDVQGLRSDAELGLADAVARANDAMPRIAQINRQLGTANSSDATTASLQDQRDQYVDQLAQLMDINVIQGDHNQITVFTNSGIQLVGIEAAQLSFDAQGSMTAIAQWSADPAKRTVGTLMLQGAERRRRRSDRQQLDPLGRDRRLSRNARPRAGRGAGAARRDRRRHGARAVGSNRRRHRGDSGAQAGFDIDLAGLLNGNSVRLTYTDNVTGTQHTVTHGAGRRSGRAAARRHRHRRSQRRVIGLDFSGGLARRREPARRRAGRRRRCSSPIRPARPCACSTTAPPTRSTWTRSRRPCTVDRRSPSGSAELPFFLDASAPYTGAITSIGAAERRLCRAHRGQCRRCWPIRPGWSCSRPRRSRRPATRRGRISSTTG